jgi:hypothetical protein
MLEGREEVAARAAFFWLLGAVALLAAYAALNEPVRYALLHLLPLAFAALFLAACAGYGSIVRAPDPLIATAIGIGIFGALSFVAALAHVATVTTYGTLIVGGLLCVVRGLQPATRAKARAPHWDALSITIILIIVVLILPFVAAPDVSTDALEYHLLVPKTYLVQNAIAYLPHFVESNYPSLAEYNFMALLSLGDDRSAKAFHFLCAMLVLLAIGRLTPNRGVAAALFISMPIVAITSGWAWNDMLFTLFVVLSIACVIEERFELAGVLFGFATWTKYTFVLAACGMIAILIRQRPRNIVRFALPAIGIAAIWMTKNAILTGNPVYPFLNSIFHSPYWTAAADRYFHSTLTHYEIPQWHWWTWIAFPAVLTLKPRIIDVHPGVLPLILLPLVFVRPRRTALHAYAIGMTVGWLLIRTEARSLLTLFAVLCAIFATHIDRLPKWRWIVGAGVALNVAIILTTTTIVTSPTRYFLGLESRRQYVEREDPKQQVYGWLNEEATVGGVMLVGLHDPYLLEKPAIFSSCCDTPIAQFANVNALKQSGVTHIAFRAREFMRENNEGLYSWPPAQRDAFLAFLRERCRPVVRFGDVTVFALL